MKLIAVVRAFGPRCFLFVQVKVVVFLIYFIFFLQNELDFPGYPGKSTKLQ